MPEVLSQEEINSLLKAISAGDVELPDHEDQIKIKIYDFNRPEVFSDSQHKTLSFLHEQLACDLTASLTNLLQTRIAFHVATACELTYEEFSRSIPNPTFLCTISMSPVPYSSVIEIDPQLISAIIDLLAGGDCSKVSIKDKREISELDKQILSDFLPAIISPFSKMWNTKITINPTREKIESNPQQVTIASPKEMVILVTIESLIGQVQGMMNICYPVNFIRIPFMTEKIKKDKAHNPQKRKLNHIKCKKYNQYKLGDFLFNDVKKIKRKKEIIISSDTLCSQKFTPVIFNKEE